MAVHMQQRRGTAAAWTAANPILAEGEMGVELDTGKWKLGDGVTAWNALPYSSGTAGPAGPPGIATAIPGPEGPEGDEGQPGPSGATGVQGPAGADGARGISTPGYDGPEGDEGPAGTPGAVGAAGATGSTGAQGPTGPPGMWPEAEGDEGAQGPPGTAGVQGIQGALGPTGPAVPGFEGPEGDEGPMGPPGRQGVDGAAGTTGAQGPAGPAVPGFPGDGGEEGDPGPPGARGVQGVQGALGPTGPATPGYDGPEGDEGPMGFAGPPGQPGPQGFQGPAGPAIPGFDGPEGDEGPQGIPGQSGAQGIQGVQGNLGPTGPSVPGFDGPEGDEGPTGPQGPPGVLEPLLLRNVITPATITATQNDYSPPGWAQASVVRLATDATRTITGFDSVGINDGQVKLIQNIGSLRLTLSPDNVGSLAQNRIKAGGGSALVWHIREGGTIFIQYDAVNLRWRAIGPPAAPITTTVLDVAIDVAAAAGDPGTIMAANHGHKLDTALADFQAAVRRAVPYVSMEGPEGDEGAPGIPGPPGAVGAQGPQGNPGTGGGSTVPGLDGQDGDDALFGPQGPAGSTGLTGPTGPQGPIGQAIFGEDGDDGWPIPGPKGADGAPGAPGTGGGGATVPGLDGQDGDDAWGAVADLVSTLGPSYFNDQVTLSTGGFIASLPLDVTSANFVKETAGPTIGGIAGGKDGRVVLFYNSAGGVVFNNESFSAGSASQRILTPRSIDYSMSAQSSVLLVYSNADSRWILFPTGYSTGQQVLPVIAGSEGYGTEGYVARATHVHPGGSDYYFKLTGVYSPIIVGNENALSVFDRGQVRWNGASAITVQGMFSSASQVVFIHNVTAAQTMTFTHEDAAAPASNRLSLPGAVSFTLGPSEGAVFVKDGTTDRWFVLSKQGAAAGATGPQGPGFEGPEGDEGPPGTPGASGPAGATGSSGPQGIPGTTLWIPADEGDEGQIGPPGPTGLGGVFSVGALLEGAPPSNGLRMVWRAPFNCTVTNVRAHLDAGTNIVINARRNQASNFLASDLTDSTLNVWQDGGAVQNTAIAAGDDIEVNLVSTSGAVTKANIQVDLTRP